MDEKWTRVVIHDPHGNIIADKPLSPEGATEQVTQHNADPDAHPAIREAVAGLRTQVERRLVGAKVTFSDGHTEDVELGLNDQDEVILLLPKETFGKIDGVKVNGEELQVDQQGKVDISIPQSVSDLEDADDYATKEYTDARTIGEVTATVMVGEEQKNAIVTKIGSDLEIAFPDLKGQKGDPLTWDDLTEPQKQSLKGEPGESAVFDPKTGNISTLAQSLGDSTVNPMSQKAVTLLHKEFTDYVDGSEEDAYKLVGEIEYYEPYGHGLAKKRVGQSTNGNLNVRFNNVLIGPIKASSGTPTATYYIMKGTNSLTPPDSTLIKTGTIKLTTSFQQFEIKLDNVATLDNQAVFVYFECLTTIVILGNDGTSTLPMFEGSRRVLYTDATTTFTTWTQGASDSYVAVRPILRLVFAPEIHGVIDEFVNERTQEIISGTTGQSTNKTMSQKAITDTIYEKTGIGDDVEFDFSQLTEEEGWISGQGKWASSHYCLFIPVVAGEKFSIHGNENTQSIYCFLTSKEVGENNSYVNTFAGNTTGIIMMNANEKTEITAPANAEYLYIGSSANAHYDRIPQELVKLGRIDNTELLGSIDIEPTENSKAIARSGGIYKQIFDNTHYIETEEVDLSQYQAVRAYIVGTTNKWYTLDNTPPEYDNYGKIIPVKPGRTYRIKGNELGTVLYALLSTNGYGHNQDVSYASGCTLESIPKDGYRIFTAPINGRYLWVSDMTSWDRSPRKLELYEEIPVKDAVKAYKEMPKEVDLSDYPAINFGPNIDGRYTASNGNWYGKIIPIHGAKRLLLKAQETVGTGFCLLTGANYGSGVNVPYATGYFENGCWVAKGKSIVINVPSDAQYLYYYTSQDGNVTYRGLDKVVLLGDTVVKEEYLAQSMPTYINVLENTGVVYSVDSFMMRYYEDEGVQYFEFSLDLGKTWLPPVENTFGQITHVHYFLDGTFLMCTRYTCYWTKDFETFTESAIYDYTGNSFSPVSTETRFFAMKGAKRSIVDGKEWHVWGDYTYTTTKPRLWYTNDNGRTIKCAFAFGLSTLNGSVVKARHVHSFEYNPFDKKFYVFTGDANDECHVMRGTFDGTDWNWELLASGSVWKLVYPEFFDGYFTATTDYTESSLADKKGQVKCPTDNITEENLIHIFKMSAGVMGAAAITKYFVDNNGWRFILTDFAGGNKILLAKNDFDFHWIYNTDGYKIGSLSAPNANGEVYSSFRVIGTSVSDETNLTVLIPRFNFTKAIREAGAYDFCNYKTTDY